MRKIAAGGQLTCLCIIQFRDRLTGSCGEVNEKWHLHLPWSSVHQEWLELILQCHLLSERRKLSIVVKVIRGCFTDLPGTISDDMDDEIAIKSAFTYWRPMNVFGSKLE